MSTLTTPVPRVPPAVSAQPWEQALDTTRYHYLDNLRALAMLAGVLFHVGMGFSAILAEVWPLANAQTSISFDYWVWILHTFRMPLFFLVAGFFAHYLISKRGLKGFIKNRVLRITLPFMIFWLPAVAAIFGLIIYAANSMDVDTPIIQMIKFAMANPGAMEGQEPPLSTTHLWFLYYLSIFCFASALIYRLLNKGEQVYRWLSKPWVLFVALPAVTALALHRLFMPHPAPESFVPALWALAFYGLFFTVGWAFFSRREILDHIIRAWPYLLISSAVAAGVFISQLPEPVTLQDALASFQQSQPLTTGQLLRVAATAVLAWHMSFLCLLAAYRVLNRRNSVLRYMADGSYWVYIVHLPIVMYLQAVFHSIDLPLALEFLLISFITLLLGYLSYALLVRWTPIGWLLNGRKSAA